MPSTPLYWALTNYNQGAIDRSSKELTREKPVCKQSSSRILKIWYMVTLLNVLPIESISYIYHDQSLLLSQIFMKPWGFPLRALSICGSETARLRAAALFVRQFPSCAQHLFRILTNWCGLHCWHLSSSHLTQSIPNMRVKRRVWLKWLTHRHIITLDWRLCDKQCLS